MGRQQSMTRVTCRVRTFPVRGRFTIARGSATAVRTLEVTLTRSGCTGRGECSPERIGMTADDAMAAAEAFAAGHPFFSRDTLSRKLPPGPVRNALDLALWDLEAKQQGVPVWRLAGLPEPAALVTAFTISIDRPELMEQAARSAGDRPLLKVKLTGSDDLERVRAVRRGAPGARVIVDANGSWSPEYYRRMVGPLFDLGVGLIEQPLPPASDGRLAELERPIPVCADESCRDRSDLPGLVGRYEYINIKLDKCGGLTEALDLQNEARRRGFGIMVGCMLSSSLAIAPAVLLAQSADLVDLDGHLLLARDRARTLGGADGRVLPPEPALWG